MSDRNPEIVDYHAHVYFSAGDETDRARALCSSAGEHFGDRIEVGRFHERPVGPHPRGSCQLRISTGDFEEVLVWLAANRDGIAVFCHLNTGQSLLDHTEHVVWLGPSETLRLEVFS